MERKYHLETAWPIVMKKLQDREADMVASSLEIMVYSVKNPDFAAVIEKKTPYAIFIGSEPVLNGLETTYQIKSMEAKK